jgi:hypothetical protein
MQLRTHITNNAQLAGHALGCSLVVPQGYLYVQGRNLLVANCRLRVHGVGTNGS